MQKSYIYKYDDGKPEIIDRKSRIQVKTLVSSYHKIQRITGTFDKAGKTLNDYPADFWRFDHVETIDLSGKVDDSQIIGTELFSDLGNLATELLLIKTGYGIYRSTDRYTLTPPGLSADLALFLRKKFPKLRCVGMDLISVSSYGNREEGRKAHCAFLNPDEGEPILLIEDMKLDTNGNFNKVIVAPLLIDNADGAPCTVLAYTE